MKRVLLPCLFLATVLLAPMAARAAFVLYFHTFGEWSVSCWRDPFSSENFCSLSAPPPALNTTGRRGMISLAEEKDGLVIWAFPGGEPRDQVSLRVDDNSDHLAQLDINGRANWRGAEALDILDEFISGDTIRLNSFPVGGMSSPVEIFSLEAFPDALSAYQAKLLAYGASTRLLTPTPSDYAATPSGAMRSYPPADVTAPLFPEKAAEQGHASSHDPGPTYAKGQNVAQDDAQVWYRKAADYELGMGLVYTTGQTDWNHDGSGVNPLVGNPTSELTYEEVDTLALEVNGRVS
ncbi:MAG: hypothetical protein QF751_06405, partial [Alphaproteobacteria bacterium]|nr:hypothetical protein [Alphaproteobacteria bacterium]